jgi:hypothetical protein
MSKPNRYATRELAQSAYGTLSVKVIKAINVEDGKRAMANGWKPVPGSRTDRNCSYCGRPVILAPTSIANLKNYDMVIMCNRCEKDDRRITLPH